MNPQEQAKQSIRVDGVTKISVAPIGTFSELLDTAEKVLTLTDSESANVALTLVEGAGEVAAAVRDGVEGESRTRLLYGLSTTVAAVFQIAADHGMPVEVLLEGVRGRLEMEAQKAARGAITEFFKDRGFATVAP